MSLDKGRFSVRPVQLAGTLQGHLKVHRIEGNGPSRAVANLHSLLRRINLASVESYDMSRGT